jgi:two-component system, OmpR family, phosphate regulon sensor histidine kinase PhoR
VSAPLGLRARIAVTALAASASALLAVLLLVGPRLRENALDHTRGELLADARLMARVVEEPLARGMTSAELDAIVDEAARDVRARVTVILPNGKVVADSANSGDALAAEENHAGRPEIVEALATGTGGALRHSVTVGDDLLYAAVAIRHQGRVVGVSRVAYSVAGIEGQVADLRWKIVLALALAFAVTAVLSVLLSSSLAGPLAEIMETARQVGAGNFGSRIRIQRNDELGELAHILNLSADQLQQRLTENARDRARTEAILSAMDDGVLAVDHRGIVILANNALRHNLDLQDPIGHHHVEAIRQREVGDVLQEVLRTAKRKAVEVDLLHQRRAFSLTGVPFPGTEGTPHGAVLTFHDITERRRLERIRRDFVANASHELRTPLTSIRGFVEALEDGALAEPETAIRFLGKIHTHADRMGSLVEDLLELSRLESGERPPLWEEVPPTEIAEDVAASFGGQAGRKGITLSKSDSGAPPVTTDADRLRRIVENLVDNAIKYTPAGGHVEIRTAPGSQGGAVVEVRDDGPGIPAEHLPRIFERFYRVDKARSRELGGTGLGLAIVKHLAEGMGATITVASDVGKGTRFTVSVPLGPGPSAV